MINEQDLDIVTRTVIGEARGEGRIGMTAVAHVIRNRVSADLRNDNKPDWWGEGYTEVCKKPWQFSCWLERDPNAALLASLKPTDPIYASTRLLVIKALSYDSADTTNGATHYCTKTSWPKWRNGRTPCAEIGNHVFFKGIEK